MTLEDRSKSTVLARIQRIENSMFDMRQTVDRVFLQIKSLDEKFDRFITDHHQMNQSQRLQRSRPNQMAVQFATIKEEVP